MLVRWWGLGEAVSREEVERRIVEVAQVLGVDPSLALAVAEAESGFRQHVRGSSGEVGVFQVRPIAARDVGIDPALLGDLDVNIEAGIRYLKKMLSLCPDVETAVMAYNAGPDVCRTGRAPSSSYVYASRVMMAYDRYRGSPVVVAGDVGRKPEPGAVEAGGGDFRAGSGPGPAAGYGSEPGVPAYESGDKGAVILAMFMAGLSMLAAVS